MNEVFMKTEVKEKVIKANQKHESDTGSVEVQIALLTDRINQLNSQHLAQFSKDRSARFGLIKLVTQRRKFLDYLKRTSAESYYTIIDRLNIRK